MENGGLRTHGITKKLTDEKPLISIVTVVYNGESTLEQTIQSVLNQNYDNVEYIIVDGGSKDRTLDIIKKYEDKIDYWQSEPDKGIYDAMNKGINLASGDFINFMNSGDYFANEFVIEKISKFSQDIIYGNVLIKQNEKIIELKHKDKLRFFYFAREATICHQSIFAKKSTFENNLFDQNYKIVADRVWLKHCIDDKKCTYYHVDIPVCFYDNNGLSSDLSKQHEDSMRFIKNEYGFLGIIYAKIVRLVYKLYLKVKK